MKTANLLLLAALALDSSALAQPATGPVRFNTAFEGAALERVEVLGETEFRVHVPGQHDERGRNRQATWYYFRMDNVRGRDLTITLTGFAPFEYNDKPVTSISGEPPPVYSHDGVHWQVYTTQEWDNTAKEGKLKIHAEGDSLWIAEVEPYPYSRLVRLLDEISQSPHARVEIVGRSVLGRELPVVTVSDFAKPDAAKKTIWLQARDHAWESPTSLVMEGALKFAVSDDPAARSLRENYLVRFTPMVDPDGSALGKVRFNANGWDFNRHWDEIDLRDPVWLQRMPEVWYYKKAVRDYVNAGTPIAFLVHLHNTNSEYMTGQAPTEEDVPRLQRLFDLLVEKTQFDPSRPISVRPGFSRGEDARKSWWLAYRVPLALIELRVTKGNKLKGYPTSEQRYAFGRELILTMAEAAK